MKTPLYIVGPCSAESRDQMMETAAQIHTLVSAGAAGSFVFRAGVWKPRTSPNTFQGVGEQGLEWLQEVREQYGFSIATEVATPEHVKAALSAGIDYLWIGARTSANPIAVQSLADEMENGAPKAVLIKNPVNADAKLWLGNIERLEKTGIPVLAVHRGCDHRPCWSMAHEVRLSRPEIPMLLDPSHMSGDAAQVPGLMTKIADLGLDGAMIEVHCHPEEALSDEKQQIRPADLSAIIGHDPIPSDAIGEGMELNWLRAEIDELDERLWDTISRRMDVSRRIGAWKKAHGVAPLQPERYQQILAQRQAWAAQKGLPSTFIEQLWNTIHEESLQQQA